MLIDEDWSTLLTYQKVLDELQGKGSPDEGRNLLIQQAQRYG